MKVAERARTAKNRGVRNSIFGGGGRFLAAGAVTLTILLHPGAAVVSRAEPPAGAERSTAKAFIVVDDKSGHVLAGSRTDDKLQVASLTKVATAVVVLDWVRLGGHTLDETVTVPAAAVTAAGTGTPGGLQTGDEVSVRDLLYAALLQSDNVAADALAEYVGADLLRAGAGAGGDTPRARRGGPTPQTVRFVAEMNALARHLGMARTRFLNPTGSDGAEKPYSTAADLARLTRHAMAKADFRFFVSQKERRITVRRAGTPADFMVNNTNQLLGKQRVDGVKTGSTTRAGECLIVSAARDPLVKVEGSTSQITPRRVIVVLLGSGDRFGEGATLIERGAALYDQWAAAGYPSDPKQPSF